MRRLLREHNIPELGFHGQDPTRTREELIRQFRETAGFMCMVLTTRAGGLGINLGTCAIFRSEAQLTRVTAVAAQRCVMLNLSW